MFELKNKVALITGAARGMGESHARILASLGAKVAVTDIDEINAMKVADAINKSGGEAISLLLDITKYEDIDRAVENTVRHFGKLDILINNAGIFFFKPAFEMSEDDWDRMLGVNLKGQFFMAVRAAKEMARNNWGRIINVSSIGGAGVGLLNGVHYAASKAGIIGMTKSLAIE